MMDDEDLVGVPVYCEGCTFVLMIPRALAEAAAEKWEKRLDTLDRDIDRIWKRILAPGFLEKAPEEVVADLIDRERKLYHEYRSMLRHVEAVNDKGDEC